MRLIRVRSPQGSTILVNADQVRALFPSGINEQNTMVAFDRDHSVVVAGALERIAQMLEPGTAAEESPSGEGSSLLRRA
jgi:hypothetical protein